MNKPIIFDAFLTWLELYKGYSMSIYLYPVKYLNIKDCTFKSIEHAIVLDYFFPDTNRKPKKERVRFSYNPPFYREKNYKFLEIYKVNEKLLFGKFPLLVKEIKLDFDIKFKYVTLFAIDPNDLLKLISKFKTIHRINDILYLLKTSYNV
jgi:hypothetical protein